MCFFTAFTVSTCFFTAFTVSMCFFTAFTVSTIITIISRVTISKLKTTATAIPVIIWRILKLLWLLTATTADMEWQRIVYGAHNPHRGSMKACTIQDKWLSIHFYPHRLYIATSLNQWGLSRIKGYCTSIAHKSGV